MFTPSKCQLEITCEHSKGPNVHAPLPPQLTQKGLMSRQQKRLAQNSNDRGGLDILFKYALPLEAVKKIAQYVIVSWYSNAGSIYMNGLMVF